MAFPDQVRQGLASEHRGRGDIGLIPHLRMRVPVTHVAAGVERQCAAKPHLSSQKGRYGRKVVGFPARGRQFLVLEASSRHGSHRAGDAKAVHFVRVQGLPGCLPWGMFLTFFNDFLSQQKGLSVPVATMVRRTLMHAHMPVGTPISGRRDRRRRT